MLFDSEDVAYHISNEHERRILTWLSRCGQKYMYVKISCAEPHVDCNAEISMSYAERQNVSGEEAQIRLQNHFQKASTTIIAQEKDLKEGFHYHVTILVVTNKYM